MADKTPKPELIAQEIMDRGFRLVPWFNERFPACQVDSLEGRTLPKDSSVTTVEQYKKWRMNQRNYALAFTDTAHDITYVLGKLLFDEENHLTYPAIKGNFYDFDIDSIARAYGLWEIDMDKEDETRFPVLVPNNSGVFHWTEVSWLKASSSFNCSL